MLFFSPSSSLLATLPLFRPWNDMKNGSVIYVKKRDSIHRLHHCFPSAFLAHGHHHHHHWRVSDAGGVGVKASILYARGQMPLLLLPLLAMSLCRVAAALVSCSGNRIINSCCHIVNYVINVADVASGPGIMGASMAGDIYRCPMATRSRTRTSSCQWTLIDGPLRRL